MLHGSGGGSSGYEVGGNVFDRRCVGVTPWAREITVASALLVLLTKKVVGAKRSSGRKCRANPPNVCCGATVANSITSVLDRAWLDFQRPAARNDLNSRVWCVNVSDLAMGTGHCVSYPSHQHLASKNNDELQV